jgi:hypothetical protein
MSAWRRRALALLPSQRAQIERASTPEDLWKHFHALALRTCAEVPVDERLLGGIFAAVPSFQALSGLIDEPLLRAWLPRFISETAFLARAPVLSARLGAEQFAAFEEEFFQGLVRAQEGTRIGALRAIKDALLDTSPEAAKGTIRGVWTGILELLEVGEAGIALENFLDNLYEEDVRIPPDLGERLATLCIDWGVESRLPIARG